MAANATGTPYVNTNARRKNRMKAPFGDEDIPIVFALPGGNDHFQRRASLNRKTAFIYDERMLLHKNIWFPNFVECPERLSTALDKCTTYGLLSRCLIINPEPATDEMLSRFHRIEYIEQIKRTTSMSENELKELSATLDSVYLNEHTDLPARLSVGSWIQAVDLVHRGDVRNAFCLVRPPGHHALENEACGFCIFNNVVIAAQYAMDQLNYNRILIVDWDVHHGNTTQYAFYDNPKVLFISIHRYDNGQFWPNLRESNYDFIGSGRGRGYNVNISLNEKDVGDSDYLTIFHRIILPLAYEFDPELVLISAGYDSAFGCPLGELNLSPAVYAHLTHKLMVLAEGKVIVGLEGGYYLDSLGESVGHTLSALLGDPMPSLEPMKPINPSVLQTISNCVSTLSFRWKSLHLYPVSSIIPFPDISHLKLQSWFDIKVPNFEPTDRGHKPEAKAKIDAKLEHLKSTHPVACNTKISGTCLVYDSRMENHKNEEDRTHPEMPNRIRYAYEMLDELGLSRRCKRIEARYATQAELLRVHTEEYVNRIAATASVDQSTLNDLAAVEDSIYFNRHTYDSARLASGSVIAVVDEVCSGGSLNGVAVIRPPGHHALKDGCMGFCFFNNIAVGARHAQQVHGLERIAIIDWDVHHGNGTAKIFEDDPNILYISVHRFDNGRFFPNTDFSSAQFCGLDEGLGRTVHVAWNGRHVKDGEYIIVFNNIIIPILYEFRPQLILVSAGFDAVRGDRLGGLGVSPECFGHLTHLLMTVAHLNPSAYTLNQQKESQEGSSINSSITTPSTNAVRQTRQRIHQEKSASYSGGVIIALEGGYQLSGTAESLCHCVSVLLGDSCPRLAANLSASEKGCKAIRQAIEVHEKYWNMLKGFDSIRRMVSSRHTRQNPQNNISTNENDLILHSQLVDDLSLDDGVLTTPTCNDFSHLRSAPLSLAVSEQAGVSGGSGGGGVVTGSTSIASNSGGTIIRPDVNPPRSEVSTTHHTATVGQMLSTSVAAPSSSGTLQGAGTIPYLIEELSNLRVSYPATDTSDRSSLASELVHTPQIQHYQPNISDALNVGGSTANAERNPNETQHLPPPPQQQQQPTTSNGFAATTTVQDLMNLTDITSEDIHEFFGLPSTHQLPSRLFAVAPLNWCPHLTSVQSNPTWQPDIHTLCRRCDNLSENWVCLSCYAVYCGRYANSHMVEHFSSSRHPIVLSYADLSSWCYECESYVHNEALLEMKRAAHRAKFGVEMPGS
uniref:UBP-type domain-containing protein n=1 Tax=Trichobilharzia regenti TaxID=157069 RepID=A0AA85KBB7_TRIRE|nr:unnamed protein product [Trichobilharzia regenti]